MKSRKLTKSKPEVLIYSVQGSQPWPFRAWGTHIRLLKNSRLLDLGPAAQSYSLKEKYMLISFTVRSHVIFAFKKILAYWDQRSKPSHIRLKNCSAINFRPKMFENWKNVSEMIFLKWCFWNDVSEMIMKCDEMPQLIAVKVCLGWSSTEAYFQLVAQILVLDY